MKDIIKKDVINVKAKDVFLRIGGHVAKTEDLECISWPSKKRPCWVLSYRDGTIIATTETVYVRIREK